MKKRIKYTNQENIIFSEEIFCSNAFYMATIRKELFTVEIVRLDDKVVERFKCENMHEAKRKIKAKFKELGAIFYTEKRKKVII